MNAAIIFLAACSAFFAWRSHADRNIGYGVMVNFARAMAIIFAAPSIFLAILATFL